MAEVTQDAEKVARELWREGVQYGLLTAVAAARGSNADLCKTAGAAYRHILEQLRKLTPEELPDCYRPAKAFEASVAALRAQPESERIEKLEAALRRIAACEYDDFAGDPGKWAVTIAKKALAEKEQGNG